MSFPVFSGSASGGSEGIYDASSGVILSGANLVALNDTSGKGRHLQNAPVTKAQYSSTGWNSAKPSINIGGNSYVATTSWVGFPSGIEKSFTIIAVCQTNGVDFDGTVWSWWNPTGGRITLYVTSGLLSLYREDILLNSYGTFPSLTATPGSGRAFFAARYFGGGAPSVTLNVDASVDSYVAVTLGNVPVTQGIIGAANTLASEFFNGRIAQIELYNFPLSDPQLAARRTALKAKWGGLA